jgi:YD repeat-containing protein
MSVRYFRLETIILILSIVFAAAYTDAGSVVYQYDDLGRLVSASYQDGSDSREFSYSYDNTGNRTGKTISGAFVSPYPYGSCGDSCDSHYIALGCYPSYTEALRARNVSEECNTDMMIESPTLTFGYLGSAFIYCPYAPENSGLTCTITNSEIAITFIFYYY